VRSESYAGSLKDTSATRSLESVEEMMAGMPADPRRLRDLYYKYASSLPCWDGGASIVSICNGFSFGGKRYYLSEATLIFSESISERGIL
jgi:hypothetical protein